MSFWKVLFVLTLALTARVHAATEAEALRVLEGMNAEALVKAAVVEVNDYQLSKRQEGSEESRKKARAEFATLVGKRLSWPAIEPVVVKSYAAALSSPDAVMLAGFFRSEPGQSYVNGVLASGAQMAIALDRFVDELVDRLMDEPVVPLDFIARLAPSEQVAAQLMQTLRPPKEKADFAAQRKAWLASMDKMLRPETKDKKALQRHAAKMAELGRVFSEEQVTWRMARELSRHAPQAQLEPILTKVRDPALLAALHASRMAGKSAEALVTQQFMADPEVREWMSKQLAASE